MRTRKTFVSFCGQSEGSCMHRRYLWCEQTHLNVPRKQKNSSHWKIFSAFLNFFVSAICLWCNRIRKNHVSNVRKRRLFILTGKPLKFFIVLSFYPVLTVFWNQWTDAYFLFQKHSRGIVSVVDACLQLLQILYEFDVPFLEVRWFPKTSAKTETNVLEFLYIFYKLTSNLLFWNSLIKFSVFFFFFLSEKDSERSHRFQVNSCSKFHRLQWLFLQVFIWNLIIFLQIY